jgi:uncharacterized protein
MRPIVIDHDDKPAAASTGSRIGCGGVLIAFLILFAFSRTLASMYIDYAWWQELNHGGLWLQLKTMTWIPWIAGAALLFVALNLAFRLAGGWREAGGLVRSGSVLVFFVLSIFITIITLDSASILRWYGFRSSGATTAWRDSFFNQPLSFYFFDLPLYDSVIRYVGLSALVCYVVIFLARQAGSLASGINGMREGAGNFNLKFGGRERGFLERVLEAILLLCIAAGVSLGRFDYVTTELGYLTGLDWLAENVRIPLLNVLCVVLVLAALAAFTKYLRYALILCGIAVAASVVVPMGVQAVYLRPNEISLQRPYIQRHLKAAREGWGLAEKMVDKDFPARLEAPVDLNRHREVVGNFRLWDWRPFHDTVTQLQSLRPYYEFEDSDVDRYRLKDSNGRTTLQQVLVTPREINIRRLPDAASRWINPHFIYTHGYGVVVSSASRLTSDGLPQFEVRNAPPEASRPEFQIRRPEIYFGDGMHEPVFVRTGQEEFNYPSGSGNVHNRYEGSGGILLNGSFKRLMAAVSEADWNIMLTSYLRDDSRMIIRRRVLERVNELASFAHWDNDPYLVITPEGRMVWIIDGFTHSRRFPGSRNFRIQDVGRINYIRNSLKATVDAYDGTVNFYNFDATDPLLQSWSALLPGLIKPAANMPAFLREHARYPEDLFRMQAQVLALYHMTDADSFYNKEDVWETARTVFGQNDAARNLEPTFVIATLPGEKEAEFLLTTAFTPRNKTNMIGLLAARCDGDKLGQLVLLRLSKQELLYGPVQVSARIDSDQNISRDLTLWNQQGSTVIRGQMLVVPVEDTFLYVEPIYVQGNQAPMPQLRKVAVAMGSRIGYADTLEQALAQITDSNVPALSSNAGSSAPATAGTGGAAAAATSAVSAAGLNNNEALRRIREALRKYRELTSQGRYVEAAQELQKIESAAAQ